MKVTPHQWSYDLTLEATADATPEIQVSEAKSGTVHLPTGSSITSLTYHAAPQIGGTYNPLHDSAGAAVTQTTLSANKAYQIPAAVFGSGAIKIAANAQGAVSISLKG